jgi:hypothetical protein
MSPPDTIRLFINSQSVITSNQEKWTIEIPVATSPALPKQCWVIRKNSHSTSPDNRIDIPPLGRQATSCYHKKPRTVPSRLGNAICLFEQ